MDEIQVEFDQDEVVICERAVSDLANEFSSGVSSLVSVQIRVQLPVFSEFYDQIEEMKKTFNDRISQRDNRAPINERHLPMLKSALLAARKREAREVEKSSLKTKDPSTLSIIREKLNGIETLLKIGRAHV